MPSLPEPDEVALVRDTMVCQDCSAHWVNPRNFGPFVRCAAQDLRAAKVEAVLPVRSFEQPTPAILHGCRKAPVMQIGINPNLTGFFTLPMQGDKGALRSLDGPLAVYPHFDSVEDYALHHRYVHLEASEYRMAWPSVEPLWDTHLPILRSEQAGQVEPIPVRPLPLHPGYVPDPHATSRRQSERRAQLQLRGADGSTRTFLHSWTPLQNFMLGVPIDSATKTVSFAAQQAIAGTMTEASTIGQAVRAVAVGGSSYFKRAAAMFAAADLVPGEDVSMHDMVACATPGWSEEKYAIQQAEFHAQCVRGRQYTARQIRQSQPVLLIFSGLEAFEMFLMNFRPFIRVLPPVAEDMRATGLGGQYTMHVPSAQNDNRGDWTCSILVLSHFSFSVEPLQDPDPRIGFVVAAVQQLRAEGRLAPWDVSIKVGKNRMGNLVRTPGSCQYCEIFHIPGGCAYLP